MFNHLKLFLLTCALSNKLGSSQADLNPFRTGCYRFEREVITFFSSQGHISYKPSYHHSIHTQVTVPDEVTSFTLNCTFCKPIQWTIWDQPLPNNLVLAETIVHYSPSDWAAGKKRYSSNLIFYDVREEITGVYGCSNVLIDLFTGQRSQDSRGFLLRRGTIDTREIGYKSIVYIRMACQVTLPTVEVQFFYSHQMDSNSSGWTKVDEEFLEYSPLQPTRIDLSVAQQFLGENVILKCQTNITGDFYILEIIYKDFTLFPEQGITEILTIPSWNEQTFQCNAEYNVYTTVLHGLVNVTYEKSSSSSVELKPIDYGACVECGGISSEIGVIQCNSDNGTLHSWKHRLFIPDDISFHYEPKIGLSIDEKTRRATCVTIAVEDAQIIFVIASEGFPIFNEYCLEYSINGTCPERILMTPVESSPISMSVQLPPVTGSVQCLSLDVTKKIQYFLNTDETTISMIPLNKDLAYAENISHEISCSINFLGEPNNLECKCLFSRTLFASSIFPIVIWKNGNEQLDFADVQFIPSEFQKLSFHYKVFRLNVHSTHVRRVSCIGFSLESGQHYFSNWTIATSSHKWSESLLVAVSVPSVAVPMLLFVFVFVVLKFKSEKTSLTRLDSVEIGNFLEGDHNLLGENGYENAQKMAFAETKYQIDRNCLSITRNILGSGAYGVVLKGSLKEENDTVAQDVAVKMVKPGTHIDYLKALLEELKVMAYIGRHQHIAELIGAVTDKLTDNEIFVVLKFYLNGSLGDYLKNNRNKFVHTSTMDNTDLEKLMNPDNYIGDVSEQETITEQNLVQWSYDIACGMDYLVSKKIIHGDLAARNILLDENRQIKISDFGLARQLYNYSLYVKKAPLPWRWMSIEAMCDMAFSSKSDVWAYGVTVWEIFSLGLLPFPTINWDEEFIQFLTDGHRLVRPSLASNEIYNGIMYSTWNLDPKARPTFRELSETLERFRLESTYLEIAQ